MGIEEARLVDPGRVPQEFFCSICTELATDPCVTRCCANMFCTECMSQLMGGPSAAKVEPMCPSCREPLAGDTIKELCNSDDALLWRIYGHIRVRCLKRDCFWEGELSDMKEHDAQCVVRFVARHTLVSLI